MSNTEYDKKLSVAATMLGENTWRLIGQILKKHDAAVIEASLEAIEDARAQEREACAVLVEEFLDDPFLSGHGYASGCAAAIRARGAAHEDLPRR